MQFPKFNPTIGAATAVAVPVLGFLLLVAALVFRATSGEVLTLFSVGLAGFAFGFATACGLGRRP